MNEQEIHVLMNQKRQFFYSDITLNVDYRIRSLQRLKITILKYEKKICEALQKDLGKSNFESYMCEVGLVLDELSYMIKHTRHFSLEKTVKTPLAQFCSRSFQKPSPYGVVLIISPWNYPFLLTMGPLIDAIAAGNTVLIKPSAYSPHTSQIIKDLIAECFRQEYVSVILGGREENNCLLKQKFDYIFFTGSKAVGKEVLRMAAPHLTPVTLELGGKSPCIVEKSANLKLAAKRIVFGKFLNCGQTCVAPDYIYCDESVKLQLLLEMKKEIIRQYGVHPLTNETYGKIINQKHFDRICGLIDSSKVVHGGNMDTSSLKIEPTIMNHVTFDDAVMQEEIFGPVLPILTYDSISEAVNNIRAMSHPLALYIFSGDTHVAENVIARIGFGGGCINDTLIHLATSEMPFGGFGESGMGSYHGKTGFDTFTHYKSIVDKKTWLDMPMRYQPYKKKNNKLLHMFLK